MEIKPNSTQGFFGVGERGMLYTSAKTAGSAEVRSNIILLVAQGELSYSENEMVFYTSEEYFKMLGQELRVCGMGQPESFGGLMTHFIFLPPQNSPSIAVV